MRIDKRKIFLIMARKNWLQKDLAEKAGMSRGNLSLVINGKNCHPKTVFKLSEALNVKPEEILED